MELYTNIRPTRNKLPSLAVAIGVHAVILTLALQATHHIIYEPKPPIVVTLPKIDKVEPPPDQKTQLPKPPSDPIFRAPNEVVIDPPQFKVELDTTEVAPPLTGGGKDIGGSEVVVANTTISHAPVRIAAHVDARACDKPEYPPSSIRAGEEGIVSLAMLIGTDGRVIEGRIEKSSGSRALDKAAVQGLSLCRFKAGTVDGVPEKSWAKLDYVWSISQN